MQLETLKVQFMHQEVLKGLKQIFDAQRQIAESRIYYHGAERTREQGSGSVVKGRSGRLMDALRNPKFSISPDGGGLRSVSSYPVYIRFLDMKKHGNYKIYNRQIWGILYGETLNNIRYEFRDWLRTNFPEMLKQFNKENR